MEQTTSILQGTGRNSLRQARGPPTLQLRERNTEIALDQRRALHRGAAMAWCEEDREPPLFVDGLLALGIVSLSQTLCFIAQTTLQYTMLLLYGQQSQAKTRFSQRPLLTWLLSHTAPFYSFCLIDCPE